MMLNAWGAWHLIRLLNDEFGKKMMKMTHAQFIAVYAEELCGYQGKYEGLSSNTRLRKEYQLSVKNEGEHEHSFVNIDRSVYGKFPTFVVCRIELNFVKIKDKHGTGPRAQSGLVQCRVCKLIAHCTPQNCERKIFSMFDEEMTCFQIAHQNKCKGLWCTRKKNSVQVWEGNKKHPTYKRLMELHNVEHKPRKKKKAIERRKLEIDSDEDSDKD